MKTFNAVSGLVLSFFMTSASAEVELSSLIQWEESQTAQVAKAPVTYTELMDRINELEATAAGQNQMSSLIQWEESQYAVPYGLSPHSNESAIAEINAMDATAAGTQSEMSSLIQWEESF